MAEHEPSRKVVVESTSEKITDTVSELVRSVICDAVSHRGVCRLALAGGTTPHSLYMDLARNWARYEVPWSSVEIFFGDERDVPQDHIESNYGMVQRTMLDHLPIAPAQVHPMPADADDLDVAAADYERRIREFVPAGPDGLPRFDLILLGMGADGHTASLFPMTPALAEEDRLVTAYFVPVLGRNRMTFTFPLINAAANVILFVTGSDKAHAAAVILGEDESPSPLPAASVAPTHGCLILAMDAAAAKNTSFRAG